MSRVVQNYYNKFLKREYNYHGLMLYPKMTEDKIIWYHKNPEDKSFSLSAIEGFAHEKFHDYSKFLGDYDYYRLYNRSVCMVDNGKVGQGKLYISKEDKIRFENACQDITDMEFRGMYFDFNIVDLELDNSYSEDFYIGCKINFTKGLNIRKGEYYKTYDTIKEQLCEILIHDDFRDYEYQLFNPIGQIIYNNPLLFDNEYMYTTHDIIAYSEGKKNYMLLIMRGSLYKHIFDYIDFDFKHELIQSNFDNFIVYQVKQEIDDWAEVILEYDGEDGRLFIEKKYLDNIVNLFGVDLDNVVDIIKDWFIDYEGIEPKYVQL